MGARGFRATSEDGLGFGVGPVAEDALQQIKIAAGGERVEEALGGSGDAVGDAGGSEDLMRSGDGARQIDQRAAQVRVRAKDFGEERTGSAADVYDRLD